ncbi:DNA recombination protein RmuC [Acinetobacter sp. ANC 3791]|uniref:DNA recombination protein RmuC n=1 Tax=Acinetobacter sp. ANC 3791 TaxID=2529836 RepID=UPI001038C888|nr:DNA recombination protein RmuC [Acinetobacter sp. ANC 3791]TCB81894.1 DNA recombination protein RmuC [Acinetobacter sp. ANC 3791]
MEIVIVFVVCIICLVLGFCISKLISSKKNTGLEIQIKNLENQILEIPLLKQQLEDSISKSHKNDILQQRIATELNEREKVLADVKFELSKIITENNELKESKSQLEQDFSGLKATLENSRQSYIDQIAIIDQQNKEKFDTLIIQNNDLKKQVALEKATLDQKSNAYLELSKQFSILKTSLEEREKNFSEQIYNFNKQKEEFSIQFKALANDILDAKSIALQETSKIGISAVINPFQQSIDNFKKEVHDIHHRETQQQGELKQELLKLKELNKQITEEAHQLATALKGQKKMQGSWGELILENVLERSGLQLGKDFKREVSVTQENGRLRPDVVVYLPQGKHLIIDSKVSLNAYTQYVNSENEQDRKIALMAHVKAVSDRINELASKEYHNIKDFNSPELVFMFIPIESAFVEALKGDETIFQKALEKNILVATPTTLLTSLNIIRQLWRFEDQNKHTAALANKADDVFQKLRNFLNSFQDIKKHLDKANDSYQKSENQLISGRGNLVKQVSDFKALAPSIQGEFPTELLEKANLEIEYQHVLE